MLLRNDQQRKRAAFTLMEIIVVVAIILILAGAGALVLPKFLVDANISKAKLDVKTLEQAASAYYTKHGFYPQSVNVLAQRQDDGSAAYIKEQLLTDPWGQPYVIGSDKHPTTDIPLIYSNGPPGGQQIRNWDPK
jgi:general secretion pathway protein G